MIPYGKQDLTQEDLDAVREVLTSEFLTQGPKVPEFEKAIKFNTGCENAFALNSATSALHVACLALGLGKGDWIWTSPITFVASANAGLYCGANIDFVDIDPTTYNICPEKLRDKLKKSDQANTLPKVLIPVHLSGQSCDMKSIYEICSHYDVKIIEDASHAIGGAYLNNPIGCCEYSDLTVFSFHPVKIITTGEGGAITTNDSKLAARIKLFRSHGVTRDPDEMTEEIHGPWYYQQIELGYNYRMTDIQAALGISQLKRINDIIEKRHEIANYYDEVLADFPLVTPYQNIDTRSSYHLYIVRLKLDEIKLSHKEVFEGLRSKGIGVNLHYIPVHLQPFYRNLGFKHGDFPESEKYYSEAISLPIYPTLGSDDMHTVSKSLISLLS